MAIVRDDPECGDIIRCGQGIGIFEVDLMLPWRYLNGKPRSQIHLLQVNTNSAGFLTLIHRGKVEITGLVMGVVVAPFWSAGKEENSGSIGHHRNLFGSAFHHPFQCAPGTTRKGSAADCKHRKSIWRHYSLRGAPRKEVNVLGSGADTCPTLNAHKPFDGRTVKHQLPSEPCQVVSPESPHSSSCPDIRKLQADKMNLIPSPTVLHLGVTTVLPQYASFDRKRFGPAVGNRCRPLCPARGGGAS